jgi:2-hydroxychromene-2-carboxylate isomerase
VSPWTYLGHDRFVALAARRGATVVPKPIDIGRVFAASGGLPLKQRPPQRQAYRLVELARWTSELDRPLNVHPKYFPVAGDLACKWIIAATQADGVGAAMKLAGAAGRAVWAEERNLADAATLAALAGEQGLDAGALAARAASPDIAARYDEFTNEAIGQGVFGVPWYVHDGEPFWGQDRLDFLDRKLAK